MSNIQDIQIALDAFKRDYSTHKGHLDEMSHSVSSKWAFLNQILGSSNNSNAQDAIAEFGRLSELLEQAKPLLESAHQSLCDYDVQL